MVVITVCASSIRSFFSAVTRRSWLFSVSERAANSYRNTREYASGGWQKGPGRTHLGLAVFPIMIGYSYLIKQPVELVDDGVHLL